jgi:hypothetical protein
VGCDARDPEHCLHDHVRPWLKEAKPNDRGDTYSALAPCHDDTTRSLSVSVGDRRAIIWNCFACRERLGNDMAQIRTRSALIRAGVPARCLPMTRTQSEGIVDQVRDIIHGDGGLPDRMFRLAVLLECGGEMPSGGELKDVAEWAGVSGRAAYRSRQSPPDNM